MKVDEEVGTVILVPFCGSAVGASVTGGDEIGGLSPRTRTGSGVRIIGCTGDRVVGI